MKIYINENSIENCILNENLEASIVNFKLVLKLKRKLKFNIIADIKKTTSHFQECKEVLGAHTQLLKIFSTDEIIPISSNSNHNYLYLKSNLTETQNIKHSLITNALDEHINSKSDILIFNFIDDEYSTRTHIPIIKIQKPDNYIVNTLNNLTNKKEDIESFLFIHSKLKNYFSDVKENIPIELVKKIEEFYLKESRKIDWTYQTIFDLKNKKETIFKLGEVTDLIIKILILKDKFNNYKSSDYIKYFKEKITIKNKTAKLIAELNNWTWDKKLSDCNGRDVFYLKNTSLKTTPYLIATDTEKGDFEVHNSSGEHLGAISFDRTKFENQKKHKLRINC